MDYDLLATLIPPAIALSVLAYFVNFFGKVIADQQPFTDDRKWHVQVAGSVFVLNIIFSSTIGIYLANIIPFRVNHWLEHTLVFVVLSVISTALYFHNSQESSRVYNYRKAINAEVDKKLDGLLSVYAKIGKCALPAVVPIITSYLVTLEYFSGNQYLLVIFGIIGFYILFWSAFQLSLRKLNEIAPINIYFTDKDREPICGAQVLKYNDDNIRVRVENKILILNKAEVHTIEMQIPDKLL